jgi:hypothetical protein
MPDARETKVQICSNSRALAGAAVVWSEHRHRPRDRWSRSRKHIKHQILARGFTSTVQFSKQYQNSASSTELQQGASHHVKSSSTNST